MMRHGPNQPEVELVGQDSNTGSILARCKRAARDAGWSHEQIDALQKDMLSGDYNHVLNVAMDNFEVS